MTLGRGNNSGYILQEGGIVDPFTDATIGKQGIHNMQDLRYYESTGNWTLPPGYNPQFHTTGTVAGVTITKDMQSSTGSFNFTYHPNSTGNKTGYYWNDWGTDVWDNWGYWGLTYFSQYNRTQIDHEPIQFGSNLNGSDGTFYTNSWNASDGTPWTVKHGHPVANMWMMHVTVGHGSTDFRIASGGNMGSDSNTNTRDGYDDVTISSGQTLRLRWRENSQSSSFNSSEQVKWWFIPTLDGSDTTYGTGTSTTQFHNAQIGGNDNHFIYTNLSPYGGGIVVYMYKGYNQSPPANWIADDLALG